MAAGSGCWCASHAHEMAHLAYFAGNLDMFPRYRQFSGDKSHGHRRALGADCRGDTLWTLADGTKNNWLSISVEGCMTKCTRDPRCNAFVRLRDICQWKTNVTAATIDLKYSRSPADWYSAEDLHLWGQPDQSCYLRESASMVSTFWEPYDMNQPSVIRPPISECNLSAHPAIAATLLSH